MPSSRRAALAAAARRIAAAQAAEPDVPRLRVVETVGAAACMVVVWDAREPMPTARPRRRPAGPREGCRAAVLDVVGAAGAPVAAKDVIRELRLAGTRFGRSTVTKALADLTRAGLLLNPGDKRGYRLPEWDRPDLTPSLFE